MIIILSQGKSINLVLVHCHISHHPPSPTTTLRCLWITLDKNRLCHFHRCMICSVSALPSTSLRSHCTHNFRPLFGASLEKWRMELQGYRVSLQFVAETVTSCCFTRVHGKGPRKLARHDQVWKIKCGCAVAGCTFLAKGKWNKMCSQILLFNYTLALFVLKAGVVKKWLQPSAGLITNYFSHSPLWC